MDYFTRITWQISKFETFMNIDKHIYLFIIFLFIVQYAFGQSDEYFHVEQREGKWWIIDPSGKIFHMRGANHYGDGSHMPWNLQEKYGSKEKWRESVKENHIKWGFTYLPTSIGPHAIDPSTIGDKEKNRANLITREPEWPAQHFASLDYPFTAFLEVPKQYMAGAGLPDVFSHEFVEAVDKKCQEFVLPLKDNKQLIGYHFTHNPPWNIDANSADDWIEACTQPNSAGLKEWIKLMQQVYGTIDRWRETYGIPIQEWSDIETLERPLRGYVSGLRLRQDKESFLKRICEQWYKVYHDAIRKYDQNHLLLGDRNTLHLHEAPSPWAFFIMEKYIDVLSVNVMGPPNTIYNVLEVATRNWNGPVLLADTGGGIYKGEPAKSAYQSADLEEYEKVYGGLVEMSMDHPQIIGFGWCGYYETPHPGGRSGLVDVHNDEPLPELIPVIKKWNARMENYIDNLDFSKK